MREPIERGYGESSLEEKCALLLVRVSPTSTDLWVLLDLLHRRISELESDVRTIDHKVFGDPYD